MRTCFGENVLLNYSKLTKNLSTYLLLAFVLILVGPMPNGYSQEVIVTGFPAGVGGSVDPSFFESYYPELRSLADTLAKYPMAWAIVTGGADGARFRYGNDAKNPGLALGRAHTLRRLLIKEFKVDPAQIRVQSQSDRSRGEQYRFAKVRVELDLLTMDAIRAMQARMNDLENRPAVERVKTEVTNIFSDHMGIQIGAGVSSSPFGGIPIISGGINWKQTLIIEGVVGHTFWNNSFRFEGNDLDTKRRLVGGTVTFYPFDKKRIGFMAGWLHIEELSQRFVEYVRMSEGPLIGIRVLPHEFISITGAYNPSRQRVAGSRISHADNDHFFISISARKLFGGAN